MDNKLIIAEFEKLVNDLKLRIDSSGRFGIKSKSVVDLYRLKQLKAALEIIKKYPKKIKSGSELAHYKGIGKGTIGRIDEILKNGFLSEISSEKDHDILKHVEVLKDIIGIGDKTAYEYVTKYGIKTFDDLVKACKDGIIEPTHSIKMGIKYKNTLKENIPRADIDKINIFLQKIITTIDPKIKIVICGSYRRLKPTSNDIDVMMVHHDVISKKDIKLLSDQSNYLTRFVNRLKDEKFIIDDITDKLPKEKYMGFCKYKSDHVRRIDIRFLPFESYYTGLLYFTGSGNFNEKIRRLAIDQGYMLNEYGLYKITETGKKIRINITSEEDIFEKLNMEYLPPQLR